MPPLTTRILVGPTRSRTWPMAVTALAVRLELSELSALLALLSAEVPGWALAVWLAPVVPLPAEPLLALFEPPVDPPGPAPTADPEEAVGAPPALKFAPAPVLTGVPLAAAVVTAEPLAAAPATGSWIGM